VRKRVRIIGDAGEVARCIAVSVLAIAVAVYAMVRQDGKAGIVVLGAIVLVIAAVSMLQVSRAVSQLRRKQEKTHEAAKRAERHYFKVLRRLLAAVEAQQIDTRGRSKRIGHLAKRMGERMGLDGVQCQLLNLAGQVQDIGLVAVPQHILNKPSRLGTEEFRTVKKHSELSYRILEPLTFLSEMLPAIRCHHERMNGTGYPLGLKGDAIPLSGRILAVADAYDAMTHDRPHRAALAAIDALNELRRCTPAGYDRRCVEALEEIMNLPHLREAHAAAEGNSPALVQCASEGSATGPSTSAA